MRMLRRERESVSRTAKEQAGSGVVACESAIDNLVLLCLLYPRVLEQYASVTYEIGPRAVLY